MTRSLGSLLALLLLLHPAFGRADSSVGVEPPQTPPVLLPTREMHAEAARNRSQVLREFEARVQETTFNDNARHALIAQSLEAAGYKLEPTKQPGVWRIAAPAASRPMPFLRVELYPANTSAVLLEERYRNAAARPQQNLALGFRFHFDGPPAGEAPSPVTKDLTAPTVRELCARLSKTLLELPDAKTRAPLTPANDTDARQRELTARIKRLNATYQLVETWRDELETTRTDNDAEAVRHRRALLEQLSGTLEETIDDLQRERRGE